LKKFIPTVALLMAGCGVTGSSGTPTPTPTPTKSGALSVRDGATGAEVTAVANPAAPAINATVHIEAAGFLPRDAVFTGDPVYLWPGTLDYVQTMVYIPELGERLSRWTATGFTIGLGSLADDAVVRTVVADAAAEGSRATGLTIAVDAKGDITMGIAPDDPGFAQFPDARALTYLQLIDSTIVQSRTVFKTREDITGESPAPLYNVVLHELGHVLGLGVSSKPDDVMGSDDRTTQARVFSPDERLVLKMMYAYRQPGNTAPDRDPGASTAQRRRSAIVLIAR
jgi:hypothetical protein